MEQAASSAASTSGKPVPSVLPEAPDKPFRPIPTRPGSDIRRAQPGHTGNAPIRPAFHRPLGTMVGVVSLSPGENRPLPASAVTVSVRSASPVNTSAILLTDAGRVRSDADLV